MGKSLRQTAVTEFGFATDEDDLVTALRRLPDEDAVALPLLSDESRQWLLAACEPLSYRPARQTVGEGERQVRQDFEICMTIPKQSPLRHFARVFEQRLNNALQLIDPKPLQDFAINDFAVQSYRPGSTGISPHRDHIRYVGLVALINLAGRGRFFVSDNRAGENAQELEDFPGCLLLMRQPPFAGLNDRPFHFLRDVTEARVSLGLRQDTRAGDPT